MSFKLGTVDINGMYLGSTAINQAYLGATEVFNAGGGTIVDHPTLDTGLVRYYKFEGNGTDEKGAGNMTFLGASAGATGKIGNCYSYDGINDYGYIVNPFSSGTGSFSVNVWIIRDNTSTRDDIFGSWGSKNILLGILEAGTTTCQFAVVQDGKVWNTGGALAHGVDTTAWTMYTVTYESGAADASAAKLYINGSFVTNITYGGTNTSNGRQYMQFMAYSGNDTNGASGNYVPGDMDELGVWNKHLTASEVSDLYNGGAGLPYD